MIYHQVRGLIFLIFLFTTLAAACRSTLPTTPAAIQNATRTATPPTTDPAPTLSPLPDQTAILPETETILSFGLTYINPGGNRYLETKGIPQSLQSIDLKLPGKAIWLLATPIADGIIWSAALEDGTVVSYPILSIGVNEIQPEIVRLAPGQPPAAINLSGGFSLVVVEDKQQSYTSHPIFLPLSGKRAYINQSGDLVIVDDTDKVESVLPVDAIPDARILRDENDRLLLLSGPSSRYPHGVLGDQLEATSFTLVETLPELRILQVTALPENEVIEGVAPIWWDFNGDDQLEVIITISDLDLGSRIVIFDESGTRVTQGPVIGQAFRWRHQIAAAQFAPEGDVELAVVRTPHIGGVVEFYRLEGDQLSIKAEFPAVTSHMIGSRNLDQAAAADIDGDGLVELLVFAPDLTELIAVQRLSTGAEQDFRLPIGAVATSNIAGALLPDGRLAIGVAKADNSLRIWLPGE